jgi:shikimate kinase
MKNLVLVIGPSGVGKSALCNHYCKLNSTVQYFDLDDFIKDYYNEHSLNEFRSRIGEEKFWQVSRESIEVIRSMPLTGRVKLIDVGAGSIHNPISHSWYQSQVIILLYSEPESLYHRLSEKKKNGRSLSAYMKDEYSVERLLLYGNTKLKIDISKLSIAEAENLFNEKLEEFIK